jgi:hypothetical protein
MIKRNVLSEIRSVFKANTQLTIDQKPTCAIATKTSVSHDTQQLHDLAQQVIHDNFDVFAEIPYIDQLPIDVYCRIQLKDNTKTITTKMYSTP